MNPVSAYLLYAVLALGGVAVYLMLPRGRQSGSMAGSVLGLAALVLLMVLLAGRFAGSASQNAYFYLFSIIALASATRVVTHRKPVYSALYFVLTVIAVAALAVLGQAEFLAIALIIIYAGAILVTYLFVIMLAQVPGAPVYDNQAREPLLSVFACFLLLAAIMAKVGAWDGASGHGAADRAAVTASLVSNQSVVEPAPDEIPPQGNTLAIGWSIMTRYVVVLELSGILLLVSMVGAIAMSRRRVEPEVPVVADRPLGAIGKEVPPF